MRSNANKGTILAKASLFRWNPLHIQAHVDSPGLYMLYIQGDWHIRAAYWCQSAPQVRGVNNFKGGVFR
jgi:hypothetical protein